MGSCLDYHIHRTPNNSPTFNSDVLVMGKSGDTDIFVCANRLDQ
jgi:hypothetical protein